MGCNASRVDGVPAVALCRERCNLLDEALRQSYALADAHVAHMQSLKSLGLALYLFFHQHQHHSETETLPLPPNFNCHQHVHSSSSTSSEDEDEDTETDKGSHFFNQSTTRYDSSSPPPISSAWDFLNLFDTSFDKYHLPYTTPNPHTHQGEANNKEEEEDGADASSKEKTSKEPLENQSFAKANSFSEVMKDIQILFEKASDSGNPILEMLDVGKLRYHRSVAVNPAGCKLMQIFSSPWTPVTVHCSMQSSVLVGRRSMGSENICSTLNKLCMWEKKLYDEVKGEEKLRILHQNKCRQLRRINKKGADAHRIHSLETIIALLATKIKISFQVVDNISNTICDLREHHLWPHINTFLFRFLRMWKDMLECYKQQCKEIAEARSLEVSSLEGKLSNSHLHAAIKLKSEIKKWTLSFSDWMYAQKSHVKALNGWLLRCLMHDPEDSPAGIGAPLVFVICSKWSLAMDDLSEKEVVEAVNGFMVRVNEILDKHISDPQQKATLDKELERQVKILEGQEQNMHKVIQSREIKMGRGDAVHHGELVAAMSLQSGLQQIFAAMERFTASAARAYEQLCQQIELDNHL
ncbi:hypothetical protein PIB30_051952 [Stylosanthes scabra]|uniref:Nitrate regulatory gene2 protein n=1 Tax=Stylosanthes scabra TaxID=79078 RepID=A0ABU6XFV5_9FABA|nr:hypothetical protein [Stylosanthes scabra]